MAADATPGAKGNPRFLGSGAPDTAVDLNLVSDFAASVAGETWPTYSTLPVTDNWEGRTMWVADVKAQFVWDGTTWVPTSPHFAYYQGTVSPASGANGDIPSTQSYSTPGLLSIGTNAIIIAVAGWYHVEGSVGWANNNNGARLLELTLADAPLTYRLASRATANSSNAQTISGRRYFAASSTLRLRVTQDSGVTLAATGALSVEFVAAGSAPA